MQKAQYKDLIKFFWFTNGVEKLIVGIMLTVVTGLFSFTLKKDAMSISGIVIMELAILMAGASLMALYFYSAYRNYIQFASGTKIKVTGGKNFLNNLSESFWDGKSTATISFKIEVSNDAGADVRKAVTEFVSDFTKRGSEKFPHDFSAKGWEVKTDVMLGKSSNFLLSELIYNLTTLHSKFPTSAIALAINTSGETLINSTTEESSDETLAEARWRHGMERNSHDNDFGGNHTH